jgi:hypothetical protein
MTALRARFTLVLVAAAALTGCGGGGSSSLSPAQSLADCLNQQGYDVTASGDTVRGTSPGGVEFTATLRDEKLTIDDSQNPGGPGTGISDQERTSIEMCTDPRFRPTS